MSERITGYRRKDKTEEYKNSLEYNSKTIMAAIRKEMMKRKRIKYTLFICGILWSCLAGRAIAEKIYYDRVKLSEAFSDTKADTGSCMTEVMGCIGEKLGIETGGYEIVEKAAKAIGINSGNIVYVPEDLTYIINLINSESETVIKCVEVNGRLYLYTKITIYGKGVYDIYEYKERLEEYYYSEDVTIISNKILYEGTYNGRIDMQEKDAITDRVFEKLAATENARYVSGNDMYTVYGYSSGITECVINDGIPVNVQVASYYNEIKDETVILVGSPIITEEY